MKRKALALLALTPLLSACAGTGSRVPAADRLLTDLAPTANGTCVVAAGDVWCWGSNALGELGAGTKDGAPHPDARKIPGLERVDGLWAASHSLCGLAAGRLWCWGDYLPGCPPTPTPVDFPGAGPIGPVVAGEAHVCAQVGARPYCWGYNDFGQLGNDDPRPTGTPIAVEPALGVRALAATWDSTCALSGGSVWCWGSNRYGKLSRVPEVDYVSSAQTTESGLLGSGVEQLVAGCDSYCVLKAGRVFCWGRNDTCTLGRTTAEFFSSLPGEVAGLPADVVRLVPGNGPCPSHFCVLTARGELWCWGRNYAGQIGRDPDETPISCEPVRVGGPLDGREIRLAATGRSHTCAVTDDELWCWGENAKGQLGRDTAGAATHLPGRAATPWDPQEAPSRRAD